MAKRRTKAKPRTLPPADGVPPATILVIDIGGTKAKLLATGQTEPRKVTSGKRFTPARLVEAVTELTADWDYEAIALGYPGQVGSQGPRSEPGNLGGGWVGFDYAAAFGLPVRVINDAAMQALGSYDGGRMLFLGLGTGLGSTLITEHVILPLELGDLPLRGEKLSQLVGRKGLKRLGKVEWRDVVNEMVDVFTSAFVVDYVVLGGGNARLVKALPAGARLGHNLTAFRGGFRLWNLDDVATLSTNIDTTVKRPPSEWRVL